MVSNVTCKRALPSLTKDSLGVSDCASCSVSFRLTYKAVKAEMTTSPLLVPLPVGLSLREHTGLHKWLVMLPWWLSISAQSNWAVGELVQPHL